MSARTSRFFSYDIVCSFCRKICRFFEFPFWAEKILFVQFFSTRHGTHIFFHFFSIGRVNHELYALSAGTWDRKDTVRNSFSDLDAWMKNFIDTLCINCWQVFYATDDVTVITLHLKKKFELFYLVNFFPLYGNECC